MARYIHTYIGACLLPNLLSFNSVSFFVEYNIMFVHACSCFSGDLMFGKHTVKFSKKFCRLVLRYEHMVLSL